MKANERTITLHSQEVKNGKQTFIASSAEIGGKWYKIKFTKDVNLVPKSKGLYELTFDLDDCSMERGKPYVSADGTVKLGNATLWIRDVVELLKYSEEQLKQANREALADVFGD